MLFVSCIKKVIFMYIVELWKLEFLKNGYGLCEI